jgi:hypothetical protein
MKKTLAMFVATTALTAAIGLPAWSAMRAEAGAEEPPFAAVFIDGQEALPLILVSDDDDDDDDERRTRSGHDDDDDKDDDDDDDEAGRGTLNPAPAGSVTPPQNGLFGNGAAPQVQVN